MGPTALNTELKTRLKAALAGRSDISVGQFKLIGLNEVREQAGEAWARIKSRVFTAAAQLIERELTSRDVVLPAGDGFLVVLADPAAVVTERLEAIAQRLKDFFLGHPDTKTLSVSASAGRLDAGTLTALADRTDAAGSAGERRQVPRAKQVDDDRSDGALSAWFRPVWDGRNQVIAGNASRPKVWVGGRPLDGRRVAETRMVPVDQSAIDHLAQTAGFDALMRSIRAKSPTQIYLSIHAQSWKSRTDREEILGRFNALPDNVRSAFRVRMDGMGDDVAAMASALQEIGRTGVGLMAELPFGDMDLSGFDGIDVDLFGWRCKPPSNANSSGLMDHDTNALKRFVAAAAAAGAETYLQDVRDLYVLKSARDAGIRFFSGQAVIADRQIPAPSQPLSMVDIYRTHKAA